MATHSRILAWRIPWTEGPGGLYSPWGRRESDTTEHEVEYVGPEGAPAQDKEEEGFSGRPAARVMGAGWREAAAGGPAVTVGAGDATAHRTWAFPASLSGASPELSCAQGGSKCPRESPPSATDPRVPPGRTLRHLLSSAGSPWSLLGDPCHPLCCADSWPPYLLPCPNKSCHRPPRPK